MGMLITAWARCAVCAWLVVVVTAANTTPALPNGITETDAERLFEFRGAFVTWRREYTDYLTAHRCELPKTADGRPWLAEISTLTTLAELQAKLQEAQDVYAEGCQPLSSVYCCEFGYVNEGSGCRPNPYYGPLTWFEGGRSPAGAFVAQASCCMSGYATPTPFVIDPMYTLQCSYSSFFYWLGYLAPGSCGKNAHTVSRILPGLEQYGAVLRCECYATMDPTTSTTDCKWGRGEVPQGQTVSAKDVTEASDACASGLAFPFASTLSPPIFLCAERYCECLSPDDPSAVSVDGRTCPPCTWKQNIADGMRVQKGNAAACASGTVRSYNSVFDVCSECLPGELVSGDGLCAVAFGQLPFGSPVPHGFDESVCATRWAALNGTVLTCACASPDDPMDNPDPALTCRYVGGNVPNGKRVADGRGDLCKFGTGFRENRTAGVAYYCSCPSPDDEGYFLNECVWPADDIPLFYRSPNATQCFYTTTSKPDASGLLTCADISNEKNATVPVTKLLALNGDWSEGVWAFAPGSGQERAYQAFSRKASGHRTSDLRSLYGSLGQNTGSVDFWIRAVSSHLTVRTVVEEMASVAGAACDASCVQDVADVLVEELSLLASTSTWLGLCNYFFDQLSVKMQQLVGVAAEKLTLEDQDSVNMKESFGSWILRAVSWIVRGATYFVSAPMGLVAGAVGGILGTISSDLASGSSSATAYDGSGFKLFVSAIINLRNTISDRILNLKLKFSSLFAALCVDPLRLRMAGRTFAAYTPTQGDVAQWLLDSESTILAVLIRLMFAARWEGCYVWFHRSDTHYRCDMSGVSDYAVGRYYPVGGTAHPSDNGEPSPYGWLCPYGKYSSGAIPSEDLYAAANTTSAAFENVIVQATISGDATDLDTMERELWTPLAAPVACPP